MTSNIFDLPHVRSKIENSTSHCRSFDPYNDVYFGPPKLFIIKKDSALIGEVIQFILQTINCQLKIISLLLHGSLRIERWIKTIGKIMDKICQKNDIKTFDRTRTDIALACSLCHKYLSIISIIRFFNHLN